MLEGISTTALLIYVTLLLVVLIALTLFILLVYSGLFHSLDDVGTGKPPIGQTIIAYKFQRGPYGAAGQVFTEAAIIAPDNKAIGIYYDDPDKVDPSLTRFLVGSVLSEGAAPVNEEMVKKFTENNFKILHLPEVTYAVQTKFPHITTLSILVAVHKAYPRLKEYIEERKLCAYPFIEFYDGKMIHFMAPLSRQDEFFVPECELDTSGDQGSSGMDSSISASIPSQYASRGELYASQDSSQTPADDNEIQDQQNVDNVDSSQLEAAVGDPADHEDISKNNNGLEDNGDEAPNDNESASDDSSSSFEVLKTEATE